MAWWVLILYGSSSYLLTLFWYHAFYDICEKHIHRMNYQQRSIPTAMGISISLALVTMICIQPGGLLTKTDLMITIAILIATCIGLLDDITNDKQSKGLKGHLKFLLQEKRFTSGGLKAIVLTVTSIWVATHSFHTWVGSVMGTVLVALMTNAINLFDLRPGRALKVSTGILFFLILYSVLHQASGLEEQAWKWYVMLFMALLAFIPKDVHGYVMLGDTGANALGILLGILSVQRLSPVWQIGMIAVLIFLHVLAEMYSITILIERIAVLRWLDRFGVPDVMYAQSVKLNQVAEDANEAAEKTDMQFLKNI